MTSPKDSLDPSEERNLQQSAEAVEAGPHSGFTCPHCHGHLWEIQDGGHLRFRCRVGHALSADSLLEAKDEALESTLWAALNQFQENAALTRRLADRARARGHKLTAERMELRGTEAELHAKTLRTLLEGLLSPEFQLPSPDSRENDTVEEMLAGRDGYAD